MKGARPLHPHLSPATNPLSVCAKKVSLVFPFSSYQKENAKLSFGLSKRHFNQVLNFAAPPKRRQTGSSSVICFACLCCIQILLCVLPATVRKRLQRSVSLGLSSENIMCRVDIYIFLAFFVPKAKDPKTRVTPIRYLLTQTRVVPSTC